MAMDENFLLDEWENDLQGVDETRNPINNFQKEILEACEKGKLDKVKELLEKDPSLVNATDMDKYTPLHRACYSNNTEIVKYLIEKGADIRAKTEMLWEPLHSCCQWNSVGCAAILIQNGADVNVQSQGSQTPLHIAASHGANYETVQLLLMHPYIDPSVKNNNDEVAADIAKRSSRYYNIFDMVDPLLANKHIQLLK